jgi:hypothetical protein
MFPALTLPDVVIGVQVHGGLIILELAQFFGEIGVVLPVDLDDLGVRRRVLDEAFIARVGGLIRVHAHPNLRARLADGGNENFPGIIAVFLGLLHPAQVDPLRGLDGHGVVADALEDELRTVISGNGLLLHPENDS